MLTVTFTVLLATVIIATLASGIWIIFFSKSAGKRKKTTDAALGAILTADGLFWAIICGLVGLAALWLIFQSIHWLKVAPAGTATIPPRLIQPLDFSAGPVQGCLTSAEAKQLMNAPVCVSGGTNDLKSFFLCKNPGQYIPVSTVAEYLAALKNGYSAYTTADISTEAWFKQAGAALRFMAAARPARASLFDTPDLKLLPVGFLNWAGSEQREQLESDSRSGKTLLDYAAAGGSRLVTGMAFTNHTLQFRDETVEYYVHELARGDYDHDGYEDALVMVSHYYIEGSGRSYHQYLVTRKDAQRRQLLLKEWD